MKKMEDLLLRKKAKIFSAVASLAVIPAVALSTYALAPTQGFDERELCVTATRVDDAKISYLKCFDKDKTGMVTPSPSPTPSESSSSGTSLPSETATPSTTPTPTVTSNPEPTSTTPTVGNVTSINSIKSTASVGIAAGALVDFSTSYDGTKLVGLGNTSYLTSNDSGETWTVRASGGSNYNWSVLASSDDSARSYIFPSNAATMASYNNYLWRTTTFQGGASAVSIGDTNAGYFAAATSANGSKTIALNVNNTKVWVSSNSGGSWSARGSFPYSLWQDATSSSDGNSLAIASSYSGGQSMGYIYLSKDSGTTWTRADAAGGKRWKSIDSSADGKILVANANTGGGVYISKDGGTTWTEQTVLGTAASWSNISTSSDGMKIVVGQNIATTGKLFTSTDGGVTWNTSTTYGAGRWTKVEISGDGKKLYAVKDGQFYVGNL